jgi:transcriptional regulator with XRE-family HTH domain
VQNPDWKTRLRTLLDERGMPMKSASLAAGLGETFVRDILERNRRPSAENLAALARVLGTTVSGLLGDEEARPSADAAAPSGFREAEAEPYDLGETNDIDRAIAAFKAGRVMDAWRLRTSALDLAGYRPGDIVLVSPHVPPAPGDAVVAQTEAERPEEVRTVWRLYAPPVLLAHSSDRPLIAPIPLDRAVLMGTVVALFRPRTL